MPLELDSVDVLDTLVQIARGLASVDGEHAILEMIVDEAMRLTNADGATLYVIKDNGIHFEVVRNPTLGIHFGGTSGTSLPSEFEPISLNGDVQDHVVLHVIHTGKIANIEDVYDSQFDFSGTYAMDKSMGYRSQSFLTVGMFKRDLEPIGVLQLINAKNVETGVVQPFSLLQESLVEALAGMGGGIINNTALHTELAELLDSFIKLIAGAVDAKSPYTGGHCRRVPDLVMDFAYAIHAAGDGPFGEIEFSDADMYELHVAGWLHDIGKICIPEYVMDKATKLETIYDRIHEVEFRFAVAKKEAEISMLRSCMSGKDESEAKAELERVCMELDEDFAFIRQANIGGEFMHDKDIERIHSIAKRTIDLGGQSRPILTQDYVDNLCIRRGTLTFDERDKIRDHMRITIDMLEQMPFPRNLQRVPEFAGGHHETMIGTGYPKGLTRDQMSIQARMMAIADVFEALTASDRPYKPAKKLSEAMRIMGFMKKDHHLDPELFNEFVRLDVYLTFAEKYMDPTNIDCIDKEALMAIQPKIL